MKKFLLDGKEVNKHDYYKIVVGSNTSPATFEFPARGYSLESEMAFQSSLKHSSFFVEKITEKEYNTLRNG
jgi:hypothetical protein